MTDDAITASSPARRLLAERDFMLYLGSRVLNTFAIHMQTVAVGWTVYQLTNNPMDLGFVGLSQFAPMLGLFLVAGYVADRFDRRLVLASCYFIEATGNLILYALMAAQVTVVWPIFLTLTIFGTARAFSQPASQALVPNLVPKENFPTAVAWNSSAGKLSGIVGPAAGGILFAAMGTHVFLLIGVLFALPVMMTFAMRVRLRIRRNEPVGLASVLAGFSYIWHKPVVLGAISLDLFAVIFAGLPAMLPIFARDILDVGAEGLGFLRAAPAVGASIMALALTQLGSMRRTGTVLFITVALYGASILVFGVSTWFPLSLAALFVLGASDMVSVYIRLTLVQIQTPDEMRGRVSSVNAVSINASNELGDFRAGMMAAWLGAVPAVVVGGVVTLVVCAAWAKMFPELRRADRLDV
jgi:MFS family permease